MNTTTLGSAWLRVCPLLLVMLMAGGAWGNNAAEFANYLPTALSPPGPSHFSYVDRNGSLMIETGCSLQGHGDFISYELDFPGTPRVITSAQYGWVPKMASPVNIAGNGFYLSLIDHDGNQVSSAWVLWIAVYPSEYTNPDTGLIIETGCSLHGHGDFISYNLDFPGAPAVVTCAQYGWEAKMACPVNYASDGFHLALMDHDGNQVSNAWVLWIAVYPEEYNDPDIGLTIESACSLQGHGDFVPYDLSFPVTPDAVTCAQYGWAPKMACPVNHAINGFSLSMVDHDGNTVDNAWAFFIAMHSYEEVPEQPTICVHPVSLNNSCTQGEDAPNQSFEVWNCGDGTLSYTISCESGVGDWQPYGQRYAIIVMGGNVDPGSQHYTWYWGDTYGMYTELESYGFTAENIYFLSYGPSADAHPEAVDAISTTENIRAAYQWAQQECTAEDLLYIYWVDHGSTTSFQTNNGSITHAELGTLMQSIVARRIIGAYNPCYSGAVVDDISAEGVITTTSQDAFHGNSWGWAGKWRQALRGGTVEDPTDTNEDGHISLTEAYLWICPKSQAAGEHPMYDDNGDAVGHECDQAGFDPDDPTKDGYDGKFYSLDGWLGSTGDSPARDRNWLSCIPGSGSSTGEPDTIEVIYETADLLCGSYSGTITVSDPEATNDPQTIAVSLTVDCLPGDFDGDGDVDLNDYAVFADCVAGPNSAPSPSAPVTVEECLKVFDCDFDDDVDLADFATFQETFCG